jgi:hypothetical protein
MKTFLVFRVIAECAPLIIGGRDKTVLQKETCYTQYMNDQKFLKHK